MANNATPVRGNDTTVNVNGSVELTPKSKPEISRVTAKDPPKSQTMLSLPFSENSAAAEPDSISSPPRFADCYVQYNSLSFAKPHALHHAGALPVFVGLGKLAAENRRSGIFVE